MSPVSITGAYTCSQVEPEDVLVIKISCYPDQITVILVWKFVDRYTLSLERIATFIR